MTNKFLNFTKSQVVLFDGALGSMLMQEDLPADICPELLNLKKPDIIKNIHLEYLKAGANVIETNTFGGSRIKLAEYGLENKADDINKAAVKIARQAISDFSDDRFVAGSIGPTGKFLEPVGSLSFEDAYLIFSEQVSSLVNAGVDLLIIETMADLQEARAAVVAARSITDLPIITHLTYTEEGRTVTGSLPDVARIILKSLGANFVGTNCSVGPEDMLKIAGYLDSAMPNAGLPILQNGQTVYPQSPEVFSSYTKKFLSAGVSILGGCCGTTPDYINLLKKEITSWQRSQSKKVVFNFHKKDIQASYLASSKQSLSIDNKNSKDPLIIGERLNPTALKVIAEEIKKEKTALQRSEAIAQVKNGACMLDVNVSVPLVDELAAMKRIVLVLQSAVDVPLCIDSPSVKALERGLQCFCGRALVNSVNGEEKSLQAVIPIAKKYGAMLIGLTLDEKGIPETPEGRLLIAERIVKAVEKQGLSKDDIFIDPLVMAVSADPQAALLTLKTVELIKKKLGVKISLGLSNVSHGLPNRKILNYVFFQMVKKAAVDAVIINPVVVNQNIDKKTYKLAENLLNGKDPGAKKWLDFCSRYTNNNPQKIVKPNQEINSLDKIYQAIIEGNDSEIIEYLEKALSENYLAKSLLNDTMIPAIEHVGELFNKGTYFLPQVIAAATTMKKGFVYLKQIMAKDNDTDNPNDSPRIVIATVKGDVHDIGKNIVAMVLENHGYTIIDLGKNVPAEVIIDAAQQHEAKAICLSALLTTTLPEMENVAKKMKAAELDIPLVVGGAIVNEAYAKKIGAHYAPDAVKAVAVVKKCLC